MEVVVAGDVYDIAGLCTELDRVRSQGKRIAVIPCSALDEIEKLRVTKQRVVDVVENLPDTYVELVMQIRRAIGMET